MTALSTEFPRSISFNRLGGSTWNTTVVTMASGQEGRNSNWSLPRARYTVSVITPATQNGIPVDPQQFFDDLRAFFLAAKGKANSFLFWDHVIGQQIRVRFDTDSFDAQIEPSDVAGGKPIISWNSLALIEVLPPNF